MKTQLRQLQLKHRDACEATEIANKVANDSYDAALYADYINTPDTELAGLQDAYDVSCVAWNDAKDAEQNAKDAMNFYKKLVKLQDKFDAASAAYTAATAITTHNVAEGAWEVREEARQALIAYKNKVSQDE